MNRRKRRSRKRRKKAVKRLLLILGVCLLTIFVLLVCFQKKYLEDGIESLKQKKYSEAVELFQKEADREKNLDEAYRGMGMAYYEMKEYEKALQSFEKALENEAKETGTLYNFIGLCQMELEQYDSAVATWKKGIAMEDASKELKQEMMFNTIYLYETMRDWENAKTAVQEYLAQYPDDADAVKEAEFLETR